MAELADIEKVLHWAYAVQRADTMIRRSGPVGPAPCGSQMRSVEEIGTLGVRVDKSPFVVPTVPVDAETIHQAVMALPEDVQTLVILHANSGSRPEWLPDARAFPVLNKFGKPTVIYANPKTRKGAATSPVMFLPDKAHMEYSRKVYTLWHVAISALAVSLKGALERFEVTGPEAKEKPWVKEAA